MVRWGEDYDTFRAVLIQAVSDTDGLILIYENQPILAAFHSSSAMFTEASGAVWTQQRPYLQSVRSFESNVDVPNFYSTVEMSFDEFRNIAMASKPEASLPDEGIQYWISELEYTDSGRLSGLNIGGVRVTGAEFRRIFGLRSTNVEFDFDGEGMTLTVRGYGHGVGMSQFGANTMAQIGLGFEAILTWYYTDVEFAYMGEVLGVDSDE